MHLRERKSTEIHVMTGPESCLQGARDRERQGERERAPERENMVKDKKMGFPPSISLFHMVDSGALVQQQKWSSLSMSEIFKCLRVEITLM